MKSRNMNHRTSWLVVALLLGCGGCDMDTKVENGAMCPASDDPVVIDRLLRCYPPCVWRVIADCLPLGSSTITEDTMASNPHSPSSRTYHYDNCVDVKHTGPAIPSPCEDKVRKFYRGDRYCYTSATPESELCGRPLSYSGPGGSFLVQKGKIVCDGMMYPLTKAPGCMDL